MENPKLLGVDLSSAAFTWSAGADAAYPVTNLLNYYPDILSKSNTTGYNQYIVIDRGAASAADMLIVQNSNWVAVHADSVSLQYNGTDNGTWNDPQTVTADISVYLIDNTIQIIPFSSVTKRYFRIIFNMDEQVYLSAKPSSGNIYIGKALEFGSSYDWDFSHGNSSYDTSKLVSLDGRMRAAQTYAGRKKYELSFKLQSDVVRRNFDAFISTVRGDLRPFYFINVDFVCDLVKLSDGFQDFRKFRYNANNVTLKMESLLTS